jgi:hypothetical protein
MKSIIERCYFIFILFLAWSPLLAQTDRPNVNNSKLWKKCEISFLTENWDDKRKIIWGYVGDCKGDKKKFTGAFVVHADTNGNANSWADANGVHFFNKTSNKIITPIDLSPFKYIGPRISYRFKPDSSLSYFYICWWKAKFDKGRNENETDHPIGGLIDGVLLDENGNVLWKKTDSLPEKNGLDLGGISVSSEGNVLVPLDYDDEDGLTNDFEIWNRNGEVVSKVHLPKAAESFSWTPDGKNISVRIGWHEPFMRSIYDTKGNWVSGDK